MGFLMADADAIENSKADGRFGRLICCCQAGNIHKRQSDSLTQKLKEQKVS